MKTSVYSILIIAAIVTAACSANEEKQVEEKIKPVKYGEVIQTGGTQYKSFIGTSRSGSETNLSFRTNGLITKLAVKVGDKVKKGQLIAKLDMKDLDLGYQKAKAALQSAKIQLETQKSNLERVKQLYQANSASLSDYDQAKNGFANANSSYQSAQKSVDLQASQFDYAKIIAPTAGVIAKVNAEINEFAQAGNAIIVMNSGDGDIEINVGVPEKYIAKIQHGDVAEVMINKKKYNGVVTEIGFSNSGAATYPAIIKLSDADKNLRPGMPADVKFKFVDKNKTEQLVVPVKAVGEDEKGNFVFILQAKDNNQYNTLKTYVEIGALGDQGFVVEKGLKRGDLIATAGLRSLYDNRIVTLLDK